jgi:hypothetical protein
MNRRRIKLRPAVCAHHIRCAHRLSIAIAGVLPFAAPDAMQCYTQSDADADPNAHVVHHRANGNAQRYSDSD